MELSVVLGVIAIGFVHGVLPDHGWPIAATYALNRERRWLYGLLAALILGIGHLVSSVVLVVAYFWFSGVAGFADGPWLGYVAGTLLILLGIHEYRHGGHDHGHDHGGESHDHGDARRSQPSTNGGPLGSGDAHGRSVLRPHDRDRDDHGHDHNHDHDHDHVHDHAHDRGLLERLGDRLPVPSDGHAHLGEDHAERGLAALGTTALLLGFAHEEPIQILAICGGAGADRCLELMLVYSLAVIAAIVAPTLLLIAGYERHRERIERLTPYLPTITAVVLIGMGVAFVLGLI